MPTLRGFPGQPELGMCWTCTCAVLGRQRVEPRGVPSVEPSSTKVSSNSSAGRVWPSSDSMQSSMSGPG